MSKIKTYLFAAILLSVVTGCKKEEKDNTEVTIVNRINEVVTFDFYASLEDYKNNTNVYLRKTAGGSENLSIPGSTFSAGKTYYVDWYTDGYTYNNWFNDQYKTGTANYVAITPKAGSNTYYTNDLYNTLSRAVFLDNIQPKTKWRAINYYIYSNASGYISKWADLTEEQRYNRVTVNKDFTAEHEYKDSLGNIHKDILPFKVHESKDAYLEFFDASNTSTGQMVSGKLPTGKAPEYTSNTKDTILALLPGKLEFSFMMVKEK